MAVSWHTVLSGQEGGKEPVSYPGLLLSVAIGLEQQWRASGQVRAIEQKGTVVPLQETSPCASSAWHQLVWEEEASHPLSSRRCVGFGGFSGGYSELCCDTALPVWRVNSTVFGVGGRLLCCASTFIWVQYRPSIFHVHGPIGVQPEGATREPSYRSQFVRNV